MYQDILRLASRDLPKCRDFLKDIVAIKSLSGGEQAVVQRIKQEMEAVGFDEVRIDGLGSILGRVGSGPRVIAFDAHIDTVDVGDRSLWTRDPWDPLEKDGVIYGRGASDQKGGMAGMVYGAKILKELGLTGEFSVWMVGSVMEEDCDGLCWQYILREKVLAPEVVVLTEPTNLALYRGHRGRMEIEVEAKGISCHGSAPERGVNAVYKMAPIIQDVSTMGQRFRDDAFLGKGTVTISHIRSTSPSLCAVADSSTIHLDRRLTVGETEETSVAELHALPSVKQAEAQVRVLEYREKAYTGLVYPTHKYYPTWVTAPEHPAVVGGVDALTQLNGKAPEVGRWVFSTNGVATCGMFGIPTIGFGPADERFAHSPQDQIPVKHLEAAAAFYAAFPRAYGKATAK